eukprot:2664076-Heterocapsa_arctica.AAC.1
MISPKEERNKENIQARDDLWKNMFDDKQLKSTTKECLDIEDEKKKMEEQMGKGGLTPTTAQTGPGVALTAAALAAATQGGQKLMGDMLGQMDDMMAQMMGSQMKALQEARWVAEDAEAKREVAADAAKFVAAFANGRFAMCDKKTPEKKKQDKAMFQPFFFNPSAAEFVP